MKNAAVRSSYFVSTHSNANIHPSDHQPPSVPARTKARAGRHAVDCVCAMSAQYCMRTCRCASNCAYLPLSTTSFLIRLPVLPLTIPPFTGALRFRGCRCRAKSKHTDDARGGAFKGQRSRAAPTTTRIGAVMQ